MLVGPKYFDSRNFSFPIGLNTSKLKQGNIIIVKKIKFLIKLILEFERRK